jgi:2-hydroxychromene-2-carboxylate isomerase
VDRAVHFPKPDPTGEAALNLPHRTTAPRHAVLYFDFGDPCAYLASVRLPAACAEAGVSLTLEPIDASGLDPGCRPAAAGGPGWEPLRRLASEWGLSLSPPARYPFDASPLLRACLFVRDRSGQEAMAAMAERIWQAVWQDGADPGDPGTAVKAGRLAAVPEPALRAGLTDPRSAALLERFTRRALERGVRSVPAVQFDGETFEGVDGLAEAEARLRGVPSRPSRPAAPLPPDWMFGG